jgi:hypothetical protein
MPLGTEYSRAVPHIWHKKFVGLPLNYLAGGGVSWVAVAGTQSAGSVYGLIFAPKSIKNFTNWAVAVPGDWDGTSNFVLRFAWVQRPEGDRSGTPCHWTLHHWVCEDWDNVVGSKTVTQHATYTYGDEATTNNCMHCGTFEMDLTGGTFGTVGAGNTLFMTFQMPVGVTDAGTALLFRAEVEYMARYTGPSDALYTTQDKRGS